MNSAEYIFNVVVIGPNDKLNEKFIQLNDVKTANVDGVFFHTGRVENIANINFWQPHYNAESKKLVDLTFQTANAVIIVMPKKNKKIEEKFRRKILKSHKDILVTTFIMKKNADLAAEARELFKKLTFNMMMRAEALKQKKTLQEIQDDSQAISDERAGEPIYYVDKTGIITTIKTKGSIPLYGDKKDLKEKRKKITN
ncbi:MAG: hypothetical protein ACTSVY_08755 [Candidatus Helarchaeota archaeon]